MLSVNAAQSLQPKNVRHIEMIDIILQKRSKPFELLSMANRSKFEAMYANSSFHMLTVHLKSTNPFSNTNVNI